ncbi:DUF4305 domain-containing protein [Alkalihalobacillus sp. FSL R5-0424]
MRGFSPIFVATFYILLGVFITILTSNSVSRNGWTFINVLLAALAAYDFYMAFRFLILRKTIKNMQKKD